MEVGPISAPEIRAIRWVLKGWATRSVNEYREVVRAQCTARSHMHRRWKFLGYHDVLDIGVADTEYKQDNPIQSKPSQVKPSQGANWGGDLREAQVDVPLSVQPFPRLTA
jgi:hypothetical protein